MKTNLKKWLLGVSCTFPLVAWPLSCIRVRLPFSFLSTQVLPIFFSGFSATVHTARSLSTVATTDGAQRRFLNVEFISPVIFKK